MADLERFKLSNLLWDGDKDEDAFFVFLENFGNMVRSTTNGHHLENMLDSKLRRASMSQGTVPSYILDDPYFAVLSVHAGGDAVPLQAEGAGAEAAATATSRG